MPYGGFNKSMDAAAELGRNPVSKHQIQPGYGDEKADAGRDYRTTSRETKFSGANGDREIFIFPVQLTTCRIIDNPTRFARGQLNNGENDFPPCSLSPFAPENLVS